MTAIENRRRPGSGRGRRQSCALLSPHPCADRPPKLSPRKLSGLLASCLRTLALEGPLRSGALAELIQSDPSTVSRQVAAVVKDGLVERRADPDDGRASLLVLTAKGTELVEQQQATRRDWFARLLADWDEGDAQPVRVITDEVRR